MNEWEDYYDWDTESGSDRGKVFVLIIYDIIDNKRRNKLAKRLEGYGFRVQKSAFEAMLPKNKYQKLIRELPGFVTDDDSIKVYRMSGRGQVTSFGKKSGENFEEIILI